MKLSIKKEAELKLKQKAIAASLTNGTSVNCYRNIKVTLEANCNKKSKDNVLYSLKTNKTLFKHKNCLESHNNKTSKLHKLKSIGVSFANLFKVNKKTSQSGNLESKMKFDFNKNIKPTSSTAEAIKHFVDMSHPAEFMMRTKLNTPVSMTTSIDKFMTPVSYDSQCSGRTTMRKRQPAMGVSAYSLRVKKNTLNNSQISNEYVKHRRTNSNHSSHVSNMRSNSCAYYCDNDQMYQQQQQQLLLANNGTTPIDHTNQANLISIELLKNRRMHSVNALYEANQDMYSTDV